jgi:hypothetical protein
VLLQEEGEQWLTVMLAHLVVEGPKAQQRKSSKTQHFQHQTSIRINIIAKAYQVTKCTGMITQGMLPTLRGTQNFGSPLGAGVFSISCENTSNGYAIAIKPSEFGVPMTASVTPIV